MHRNSIPQTIQPRSHERSYGSEVFVLCWNETQIVKKSAGCCVEAKTTRRAVARRAKAGRSPQCCPGRSGRMKPAWALARLRCLRTATSDKKVVRASGNAPEPGTDLVRLRL